MSQPYEDSEDSSSPIRDTTIPSSPESEKAFLGSIFLDNTLITEALDLIEPDDMYVPSHRYIFRGMIACFMANEEINYATVRNAINMAGKEVDVLYVSNLSHGLPHVTSLNSYAKIIKGKALLRSLMKESSRILADASAEDDLPENVLERAGKGIFDLTLDHTPQHFKVLSSITHSNIQRVYDLQQSGESLTGVPSGFNDIDALTLGFQKTDLIVIAARPSVGKTALAVQIADYAGVEANYVVAFFSLEMGEDQIGDRFLCSRARVDGLRFRGGHVNPEEWDRIQAADTEFQHGKVFIDETAGISTLKIKAKCRRLANEQGGLDLVIVDYLQLIGNDGSRSHYSREQEVAQISKDLKGLAKDMKIPVIVLSQLNRAPENRTDHRPHLADLRESGSIEQDADVVMFIYRGDKYKPPDMEKDHMAEINLAKQRKGPTDTKLLLFNEVFARFDNLYQLQS